MNRRRLRNWIRVALGSIAALAVLGAGCGSSDGARDSTAPAANVSPSGTPLGDAGSPTTSVAISLHAPAGGRPSSQVLHAARRLLARRLVLLAGCTTCLRRDDASFLVTLHIGPDEPGMGKALAALVAPGGMMIQPVEAVSSVTPTISDPAVPSCPGQIVDSRCYSLGEASRVGVAEATTDTSERGSIILPVLTDDGIAVFNDVAAQCEQRARTCPTTQLAIVVDGTIVSAPAMLATGFAKDEIQPSAETPASAAIAAAAMLDEPQLRGWELTAERR